MLGHNLSYIFVHVDPVNFIIIFLKVCFYHGRYAAFVFSNMCTVIY